MSTRGACQAEPSGRRPVPDLSESIGVYVVQDVPKPYQFLSPAAENQSGYCMVKPFKAVGKRGSGRAPCEDGGSRIRYPSCTYSFDYEIINAQTFVSRGVTSSWCSPHR
ncbi:hypothetical protein LRS73_11720 [Methylobacterium currus]|uniref:hypothetical protein n=1 Tax=Methylobacterium currus TaxID=2051553 RepID=UPI001E477DCF|nr:hypothetical protein [Methylobacterium currus]UHC18444.1 hypothetical protein LRS73_11720 [Methylobacterium currus]